MKFHPDFLKKSYDVNTAAILSALAPILASKVDSEAELAAAARDYLEQYGKHLASLSERDLTHALSLAGRALQAQDAADGE